MASGMLGYDMAIQDRTTRMTGKLQFQILFIPFYILYMTSIAALLDENLKYNSLSCFHFIHCRCLVESSQSYRNLSFECLVKLAVLQVVSAIGVSLKRYTPRSATS
jgi:hypothetical protein